MNSREKYLINNFFLTCTRRSGRWRKLGCNCIHTPAWLLLFFSFFLFGFLLFILTADPVSFARSLLKRISSFRGKQGALLEAICENNEPRGRQVDFLRERA